MTQYCKYCKNCGQLVFDPNSDLCERCKKSVSYQQEAHQEVGNKPNEDNGENFIMAIAKIELILSLIGVAVFFFASVSIGDSWFGMSKAGYVSLFLTCGIIIAVAFFMFCFIKVFVNISRKATAIYELLRDKVK
ncbi:MAG: hypothetical protein J6V21_05305 [Alistipes sp.]|nr:hypothetical protein [Alistipes sp.]